jgi:hypothetical protein
MAMARTATSKKLPADDAPKYRRKPVSADQNTLAMSIREFCRLHGISEDQFFKMQREKWGPATMKVGSRTLISREAAAAWRREREAETAERRKRSAAAATTATAT